MVQLVQADGKALSTVSTDVRLVAAVVTRPLRPVSRCWLLVTGATPLVPGHNCPMINHLILVRTPPARRPARRTASFHFD